MPALVFEGLTGASVTLAAIYVGVAVYTVKQLIWLHKNSSTGLNTRKLFVMTCLLTSVLRIMSFSSMAILDFANEDFHIDPSSQQHTNDDGNDESNEDFFNGAFLVLFDFPDFCGISAYMLIILVWAEAYLRSRRHWLSNFRFRRNWMLIYFIFNTILYSSQVTLYSLLLVPLIDNKIELTLIYLTLATFNIGIPVCWSAAYLYLAIQFSGFPFSSEDSKTRLRTLSRLGLLWTSARLGWGIVALTTVVEGWLNQARKSTLFYTVVLISIFVLVEVIPICVSIHSDVLHHFSERDVGATAPLPVRYHTLPHDPNSLILDTQHNVLLGRDLGNDPYAPPSAVPRSGSVRYPPTSSNNNGSSTTGSGSGYGDRKSERLVQEVVDNTTTAPIVSYRPASAGVGSNSTTNPSIRDHAQSQYSDITTTHDNNDNNTYLNRTNTFSRSLTSDPELQRSNTFSATAPNMHPTAGNHSQDWSGSSTHPDAGNTYHEDYWQGGVYGRPSHNATTISSSYNSNSSGSLHTGSYDLRSGNKQNSWANWLGFS